MKTYKKYLLAALALVGLTATASADDVVVDGLKYTTSSTYATLNGPEGTQTEFQDLVIPATITVNGKELKVNKIADYAFQNNPKIKGSLTINGVTTIGTKAFDGCTGLTSLSINVNSNDYTYTNCTLGIRSFQNCTALKEVYLMCNMNSMGERAFLGDANIETVVFAGNKIPTDYNYAFRAQEAVESDRHYPENAVLYVRPSLISDAKNAMSWQNFNTINSIEYFVESISFDPDKFNFTNTQYRVNNDGSFDLKEYLKINASIGNLLPTIEWTQADDNFVQQSYLTNGFIRNITKTDSQTTIYASIGEKKGSCLIIVGTIEPEAEENPVLTIVYPDGEMVKREMPNQPLNLSFFTHHGWKISSITKKEDWKDESAEPEFIHDKLNNGQYLETENLKHSTTIKLNIEKDAETGPSTGVENALVSESTVRLVAWGRTLTVVGAADTDTIEVYDIKGTKVYSGVEKSFTASQAGVYIVTVGNQTFKTYLH